MRLIAKLAAVTLILALPARASLAIAPDKTNPENHSTFKVSDLIFEHLGDSYEWHILTVAQRHISIPLPVILYSKEKGFHIFLSSKFHHGEHEYKGFKLVTEGKLKGKIAEVDEFGHIDESKPLPYNLSLTKNSFSIILTCLFLSIIFITIGNRYKTNPDSPPRGLQNLFEPFIIFIRNEIAIPSIGKKNYTRFMPFLLTLFFFIWFANLLGLIPIFPGGANVTGNISVTLALSIFTFIIVNRNGSKAYWKHIVSPPGIPVFLKFPLPIMPLVEFIGIFIKPFVLMVRLFANILAGHMVAIVLLSLIFIFATLNQWLGLVVAPVSVLFLVFMLLIELLVALIQAYVFTLLSALYIGMATEEHH